MIFLTFVLTCPEAQARYEYDHKKEPYLLELVEYSTSQKLARGLTNIFFGWTEVMRTLIEWNKSPYHNIYSTLAVGFPYGIVRSVGRTLVGAYEVLTFYAPQEPIFYEILSES